MKNITIQFVPFGEVAYLTSYKRVKKLLEIVSEDKIILIQGKLEPEEEADLIEETMKRIGKSSKFKGIELVSFIPETKNLSFFQSFKERLATSIAGNRDAVTVIGPATIVREIKRDPTKIQLLLRK
jgi:uncharacterized protein